MGNISGWEDRSLSPTPDIYKNYLRTPSAPAEKPFSPWTVAALATLLGTVVYTVIAFVMALAGIMFALALGFSGAGANLTYHGIVLVVVLVLAAVVVVRIAAQAHFIRRRGGVPPVVASIASVAAGWTVAGLGSLAQLPILWLWVLPAIVEIVVLAKVLRPNRNG